MKKTGNDEVKSGYYSQENISKRIADKEDKLRQARWGGAEQVKSVVKKPRKKKK